MVVVSLLLREKEVVLRDLEHFHVWVVAHLPARGGASTDVNTPGSWVGYPELVLGAISSFLEPFPFDD